MKYRKKPVVIDAVQWNGQDVNTLPRWAYSYVKGPFVGPSGQELDINTLEGTMTVSQGDWIIRGVRAEVYPCKPDIFEATYEAVTE